jgi:hypothetical protein
VKVGCENPRYAMVEGPRRYVRLSPLPIGSLAVSKPARSSLTGTTRVTARDPRYWRLQIPDSAFINGTFFDDVPRHVIQAPVLVSRRPSGHVPAEIVNILQRHGLCQETGRSGPGAAGRCYRLRDIRGIGVNFLFPEPGT